jgi:hypothetical protein
MYGREYWQRANEAASSNGHPRSRRGATSFGDSLLSRDETKRITAKDSPFHGMLDSDRVEADLDQAAEGDPTD